MRIITSLVVSLCVTSTAFAQADAQQLDEAMAKAVKQLYSVMTDNLWEPIDPNSGIIASQVTGVSAIVIQALLAAGESPETSPKLATAIDKLSRTPSTGTYALAIRLMIWNDPVLKGKYAKVAQADFQMLVTGSTPEGGYSYKCPSKSPKACDMSCTHYAWLGLAQMSDKVPAKAWTTMATKLISLQVRTDLVIAPSDPKDNSVPAGGWPYAMNGGGKDAKSTMTCAAITLLSLAKNNTKDKKLHATIDKSIEAGLKHLDNLFRAAAEGQRPAVSLGHYGHLAIQRVAHLQNKKTFGGKEWYPEIEQHLLTTQRQDGSWGSPQDTAMALLFLGKGNVP